MTALSLLDRSRTRLGSTDTEAIHSTIDRARQVETLGYTRVWVAEHHGVPGIASGSPDLLVDALAHATSTIRVGSGGVMLPNHRPLLVAERFSLLRALHGERIDLGVGRSLGFTPLIREELGARTARPADFRADIARLRDYLHGDGPVRIHPDAASAPPIFVLGTGAGLEFAAELGLPAVVGGPVLNSGPEAFARYRDTFVPGPHGGEPYLVVSLDVYVSATEASARDLASGEAWSMARSRVTGDFGPLEPADRIRPESLPTKARALFDERLAASVFGTPDRVADELRALVSRTGADEVMNSAAAFDTAAMDTSDALLAEVLARV